MAKEGELSKRTALITGGGAGIGRSICLAMARSGARIAVLDLDRAAAELVAAEVRVLGTEAIAVSASVADPTGVRDAVATVRDALGNIDILSTMPASVATAPRSTSTSPNGTASSASTSTVFS